VLGGADELVEHHALRLALQQDTGGVDVDQLPCGNDLQQGWHITYTVVNHIKYMYGDLPQHLLMKLKHQRRLVSADPTGRVPT
jgi:hypothetical protein